MKRVITWPGSIPRALDLLNTNRHQMTALAAVCQDMFGTATVATGFAATATSPASMAVSIAPGNLYGLLTLDATAYSSLAADTSHSIMKQAVVLDAQTLACAAPTTSGQSVCYLIQAVLSETDTDALVLPYYNSTTPSQPYSGAANNGAANYTTRACVATLTAKVGTAATTGSQVAPAPDSGAIGLWVVTVAYGATTITSANIAAYSASPLISTSLLAMIQARALLGGNASQQFLVSAASVASQAVNLGQFPSVLGAALSVTIPTLSGNFILKSGVTSVPTTGAVTVIFPISFPNGVVSIVTGIADAGSSSYKVSATNLAKNGFTMVSTNTANSTSVYWLALGY